MELDSTTGLVKFSGDPTVAPWSIGVGLTNVSTGPVTPNLQTSAPTEVALTAYRPMVNTVLQAGNLSLPVFLTLPNASQGWSVLLATSDAPIGNLAAFNPLMGGANSGLPAGVINIGGFHLNYLAMDFAPVRPEVWHVKAGFTVGPTGTSEWSAVNGLLKIKGIGASVDLMLYTANGIQASATGSITGTFVLADAINIEVGISLPPGPDGLLMTGSAEIENFSHASAASYLGGSATPLTDFLGRMGTVGSLGLRDVSALFTADGTPGLHHLAFTLSVSSWTIPALSNWFSVQNITLELDVEKPTASDRIVTGLVYAQLMIGGLALDTEFNFGLRPLVP